MADQTLTILDGTGASKTLSMGQDAGNANALIGTTQLTDPTTGAKATITAANALKVDGSAVTQPVSGSVNVGTVTTVTNVVHVDDNAGSLTVDAPVATPVNVQIGDGTRTAVVRATGASNSLNVAIVDGSGNQITSFSSAPTDSSTTGTITALNGRVSLALAGQSGAAATTTGTWSATIKPQFSFDGGVTWKDSNFFVATSGIGVTFLATETVNFSYEIVVPGGATHISVTASAFTSGTVNVDLRATQAKSRPVIAIGPIAPGQAVSGSPLVLGGRSNQTQPSAVGSGNAVYAWLGSYGEFVAGGLGNGNTVEPMRMNSQASVLTSASRTTTTSSATQENAHGCGLKAVLNVTAYTSGSITLTIEGYDVGSNSYYTILSGAAVAAIGTHVYTVYPGIAAVANVSANDVIPREWRITVTPADATPITYSVGTATIA